jgi:hypothetical protein
MSDDHQRCSRAVRSISYSFTVWEAWRGSGAAEPPQTPSRKCKVSKKLTLAISRALAAFRIGRLGYLLERIADLPVAVLAR